MTLNALTLVQVMMFHFLSLVFRHLDEKILLMIVLVIMPLQVFPTYLMAGCGMVCAGLMLDMVTAWPAFKVSLSYSTS